MDENNNSTGQPYNSSGAELNETKEQQPSMQDISSPAAPQQGDGRTPYGQPTLNGQYGGSNVNQSGSYTPPPQNNAGYQQGGYPQGQQGSYQQGGYPQGGYNSGYQQNGYNGQNNGYTQGGYNSGYQNGYNSYPNGGYQDPYYGYGPKPSQALAVTSLVCGIVSMLTGILGFAYPILFLVPVAGLVTGIMHKLKNLPVGKGMSTAGIVLSILGFIIPFVIIIIAIANLPAMLEYIESVNPDAYEEIYDEYHDQLPQMFSAAFAMIKNLFI